MFSVSSRKGVLYLTDDILYVYQVSGRSVVLKEMLDWNQDNLSERLTDILKKSFSSVIVLNDTVDQHYRKEKVPKVGLLDAGAVIKRRLKMVFPEFRIRAFRKLDDLVEQRESGRAMGQYLFCACPDNEQIRVVINAIRASAVSFQGLSLLPMESEGLVVSLLKAFSQKSKPLMGKTRSKKKDKTGWKVFVGQNASGGLRQIVVKDGLLALTRISPIVETDADIKLWCEDVKRELSSTMGYLSRFGYRDEDPLSIVVIANNKAVPIFEEAIDFDIQVLSLREAAKIIGVNPPPNELEHVSNILHVGWVAKKGKLSLSMNSAVIDSILKSRSTATAIAGLLVLGLIGSVYFFAHSFIGLTAYQKNIKLVEAQKQQVTVVYNKEVERKEALGIDVKLIQTSFETQKKIKKEFIDPLGIIESVGRAMEGTIKLDNIVIEREEIEVDPYAIYSSEDQEKPAPSKTILKFSFPGTVDIEKGNASVIAFRNRLRRELEGADVEVTKILKDVSYRGELQSEVGILAEEKTSDTLGAEIVIQYGGA